MFFYFPVYCTFVLFWLMFLECMYFSCFASSCCTCTSTIFDAIVTFKLTTNFILATLFRQFINLCLMTLHLWQGYVNGLSNLIAYALTSTFAMWPILLSSYFDMFLFCGWCNDNLFSTCLVSLFNMLVLLMPLKKNFMFQVLKFFLHIVVLIHYFALFDNT